MSIFCSLLLASSIAFSADTEQIDYTDIVKGHRAPFSGKLLKDEALIKIIVTHEKEIKKISADYEFKITKINLDNKLRYNLLDLKYTSETDMYKTMIETRDAQLKIDSKKDVLQSWGIYGSFILGALTTVGIAYAIDNVE